MKNTPTPLPPPAHAERSRGTLEERIAQAEQRLLERQRTLLVGAHALLKRADEAIEPRRMFRAAGYTLAVLAALWIGVRLFRRNRHEGHGTSAPPMAASAAVSPSLLQHVPWERALALLWPLLPLAWRGRMGPGTASIIVTVALPLLGLIFRKRVRQP